MQPACARFALNREPYARFGSPGCATEYPCPACPTPVPQPYAFPLAAELSHRLKSMAAPVRDGAMAYVSPEPLVSGSEGTPLRPAVRVFSSAPSTPFLSLRGRSLVMADSCSVSFYSVAL